MGLATGSGWTDAEKFYAPADRAHASRCGLPASILFYESIGFVAIQTYDDDGEITFAIMQFGNGIVMLNSGGSKRDTARRDADLYIYADVNELYPRLKQSVEVVADLNDTFYGNREFIIRDNSGFWITFGMIASPQASI